MESLESKIVSKLYGTPLTYKAIAEIVGCSKGYVGIVARGWLSADTLAERSSNNYKLANSGPNNPHHGLHGELATNYKHGLSSEGYRIVHKPDWYTGAGLNVVREHILIACEAAGITEIPKGYVVHHIDCIKSSNAPSNLIIVTHKVHKRIHDQLR